MRGASAKLAVLVGPEGGFTDDERAQILARPSVVRLSLGPRILRADTAAVAVLALVQAVLGDCR
jgi:16S rRNA (uracil1498-N3)-methyltransferase